MIIAVYLRCHTERTIISLLNLFNLWVTQTRTHTAASLYLQPRAYLEFDSNFMKTIFIYNKQQSNALWPHIEHRVSQNWLIEQSREEMRREGEKERERETTLQQQQKLMGI